MVKARKINRLQVALGMKSRGTRMSPLLKTHNIALSIATYIHICITTQHQRTDTQTLIKYFRLEKFLWKLCKTGWGRTIHIHKWRFYLRIKRSYSAMVSYRIWAKPVYRKSNFVIFPGKGLQQFPAHNPKFFFCVKANIFAISFRASSKSL